jgi:hypothetical protein
MEMNFVCFISIHRRSTAYIKVPWPQGDLVAICAEHNWWISFSTWTNIATAVMEHGASHDLLMLTWDFGPDASIDDVAAFESELRRARRRLGA